MLLSPAFLPPLLGWYERNKRDLPWRRDREPYHVWLSEIMLQQTRVEAVKGYYARFLAELPDIPSLAACDPDRLHKALGGPRLLFPRAQPAKGRAADRLGLWRRVPDGL